MKNTLFLLLVLAGAVVFAACGKDEGPDPTPEPEDPITLPALPDPEDVCSGMNDFVLKRYCLNNFDANEDGKISRAEANAVTAINLKTSNVKSLAGIGYF